MQFGDDQQAHLHEQSCRVDIAIYMKKLHACLMTQQRDAVNMNHAISMLHQEVVQLRNKQSRIIMRLSQQNKVTQTEDENLAG